MSGLTLEGLFPMRGAENASTVPKAFDPDMARARIDPAQTFDAAFMQHALRKRRA